jgi:nesprin-1
MSIDRFMHDIGEKWKSISMDLRCVESMLEEVLAHWRKWNGLSKEFDSWLMKAEPALQYPEEKKMEFFQDISVWKDKYQQLSNIVSLLIATSKEPVSLVNTIFF